MTPVYINVHVDKSTLFWKYFHRIRILKFHNIWPILVLKFVREIKIYKIPAGFDLMTYWSVVNGSPYCSTLLCNSFRRGHNYRNILDFIASLFWFGLLHNIEMYYTTLNLDIQALYKTPRLQLRCMSFYFKFLM